MPVNALRKKGAKMSLQEAQEKAQKLERLTRSSNEHEAALAASRLREFDIDAARAAKPPSLQETTIEILQEHPERPWRQIATLETKQPPDKMGANWDELHFSLIEEAQKVGADAIVDLKMKGTVQNKILAGTAIKYLTSKDLYTLYKPTDKELETQRLHVERKLRDENDAPIY